MQAVNRSPSKWARVLACGIVAASLGLPAAMAGSQPTELPDHLTLLETLGDDAAKQILDELQLPQGATIHLVPESPHPANWFVGRVLSKALVSRGFVVVVPALGAEGSIAPPSSAPTPPATGGGAGAHPGSGQTQGGGSSGSGSSGEDQEDSEGAGAGAGAEGEGEAPSDSTEQHGAQGAQTPSTESEGSQTETAPVPQGAGGPAAAFKPELPESGEVLTYRVVECGVSYPWTRRSLLVGPQRYGRMASVRLWASWMHQPGRRVERVAHSERVHIDSFPGWARPLLEGQGYPFPIERLAGSSLKGVVEPMVVVAVVSGLIYLFYQNQK